MTLHPKSYDTNPNFSVFEFVRTPFLGVDDPIAAAPAIAAYPVFTAAFRRISGAVSLFAGGFTECRGRPSVSQSHPRSNRPSLQPTKIGGDRLDPLPRDGFIRRSMDLLGRAENGGLDHALLDFVPICRTFGLTVTHRDQLDHAAIFCRSINHRSGIAGYHHGFPTHRPHRVSAPPRSTIAPLKVRNAPSTILFPRFDP